MIRSIALTALLTLVVCSCARGSQTQHTDTQAAKPPDTVCNSAGDAPARAGGRSDSTV